MEKGLVGNVPSNKIAGLLLVISSIEIVFLVLLAQHLYPNYSLNKNYISDLGVGSTAVIFNSAIEIFGLIIIAASYFLWKTGKHRYMAFAFLITGIGAIGVGALPETTGVYHIISALITFGTAAIMMLGSSKIFRSYLRYYSLPAGILAIFVVSISITSMLGIHLNLALGHGGFEEILFYNEIIWLFIIGINFATNKIQ